MIIQCRNKKCKWYGKPRFEKCDSLAKAGFIRVICPKCHSLLRYIRQEDVPKNSIVEKQDAWWHKIKAAESELRPAYIIQKELSNLRIDYAVLLAENEKLKEIVKEATDVIKDALEREGLVKHVPKWMKEE